jgi:hypothetical protein
VGPNGSVATGVPIHVAARGRSVRVSVAGTTLRFAVPRVLRSATAALRRATAAYDAARELTIVERLSSRPGIHQLTVYHERAPDRLDYRIVASTEPGLAGRQAVVIGSRRWDRDGNAAWRASPQGVIRVPNAYWSPDTRDAHFAAPGVLTFYDAGVHAWYRLRLDGTGRPATLTMVAAAHFMHHTYSFRSPAISAPSR